MPPIRPATEADYDAHRIALGVPEGGIDFAFGDAFPHDADMDQLGGVDFAKGCYVGQEVVSRMEHRGTARRRGRAPRRRRAAPRRGHDDHRRRQADRHARLVAPTATGLALVRLDRAKEAMDAGVRDHRRRRRRSTLTLPGVGALRLAGDRRRPSDA